MSRSLEEPGGGFPSPGLFSNLAAPVWRSIARGWGKSRLPGRTRILCSSIFPRPGRLLRQATTPLRARAVGGLGPRTAKHRKAFCGFRRRR